MRTIFKKKVIYSFINERALWPKKGPLTYEGHINSKKQRMKMFYKEYKRMFFDHWAINTRRRKL